LYIEIAEAVGDIPGLAEFIACLNHNACSGCRKCKKLKEELFKFTPSPPKTIEEQKAVLATALPMLVERNQVTVARNLLNTYGLKPQKTFVFLT
jgi:hypothetical protein